MHLNDLDGLSEHHAGEDGGVEAFKDCVAAFVILDETSALCGSREETPGKLRGRAGATAKRAGHLVWQCRTAQAGIRHRNPLPCVLRCAPAAHARRITRSMSA